MYGKIGWEGKVLDYLFWLSAILFFLYPLTRNQDFAILAGITFGLALIWLLGLFIVALAKGFNGWAVIAIAVLLFLFASLIGVVPIGLAKGVGALFVIAVSVAGPLMVALLFLGAFFLLGGILLSRVRYRLKKG